MNDTYTIWEKTQNSIERFSSTFPFDFFLSMGVQRLEREQVLISIPKGFLCFESKNDNRI